jgi:hypothetical protein
MSANGINFCRSFAGGTMDLILSHIPLPLPPDLDVVVMEVVSSFAGSLPSAATESADICRTIVLNKVPSFVIVLGGVATNALVLDFFPTFPRVRGGDFTT